MKNAIDSYFGSPLEIDSEKAFYSQLKEDLSLRGETGLILGNFVTSRNAHQIDFLVITSRSVCHVELKRLTAPVVGGLNGRWSTVRPDGVLVPYDGKNPYRQALDGKQSISDDMHAFVRRESSLPNLATGDKFYKHFVSAVCVYPELLPGSRVPGDFKVRTCGYPELLNQLSAGSKCPPGWTIQTWVAFAMFLGLVRSEDEEQLPPDLSKARQSISDYRSRLGPYLTLELPPNVPTGIRHKGTVVSVAEVEDAVFGGRDLQLVGESGCGKSLFTKHLALNVLRRGRIPLLLSALDYNGKLSSMIDRGIAHLHPESGIGLLQSGEKCGESFVVMIDGFNECPRKFRDAFIKDIKAFSLRWNIPVLVASQEVIQFGNGRESLIYEFAPPSDDERSEILQAYHPGLVTPDFVELCSAFRTPYELSLAATYAAGESRIATRAGLFDAYVSRRCGLTDDPSLVRGILCSLAARMQRNHTSILSLSEARSEAIRFLNKEGGRTRLFNEALRSGLLEVDQNGCSFKHEMLERYFQSEFFSQEHDSIESLATSLTSPRNRFVVEFVLGAETDHTTLRRCLEELADHKLVRDCLLGRLGVDAKQVATTDCLSLLARSNATLIDHDVDLLERAGAFRQLRITGGPSWTKYEIALMNAVGLVLTDGFFIDEVIELAGATDRLWMGRSLSRFDGKALPLRTVGESFWSIYTYGGDSEAGFFPISIIHSMSRFNWSRSKATRIVEKVEELIGSLGSLTLGQKAFLCDMMRSPRPQFAPSVPEILEKCCRTRVHHLQLTAIEMTQNWGSVLDNNLLEKTCEILDSLLSDKDIFLNTAIFEALQALDRLPSSVTADEVGTRIEAILAEPDNPINQRFAHGVVASIVDGLDTEAHWEAVNSLSKAENVRLYTMAALGSDTTFFIDWILRKLLKAEDEAALPAFLRWSSPPRRDESSTQFATASYLIALLGCSKYVSAPPVQHEVYSRDSQAWALYGDIIFWLYHHPITIEERASRCIPLWEKLQAECPFEAIDPLFRFEHAAIGAANECREVLREICETFPDQVRSILEFGLRHRDKASSLFNRAGDRDLDLTIFIIRTLGEVGDRGSVRFLDPFCDSPDLGRFAIESLRKLKASWF